MTSRLDALKARLAVVTKGPWRARYVLPSPHGGGGYWRLEMGEKGAYLGDFDEDRAEAEFIAHAREDLERLVAVVDEMERYKDLLPLDVQYALVYWLELVEEEQR